MTSERISKKPAVSGKTPPKPRKPKAIIYLRQRAALEETIQAMRIAGVLDKIDAARVEVTRGLADAVDQQPDNPILFREYRQAEKALREESVAHGDPFDQLIASLNAEVGNTKKQETPKPRT